MPARPKDIDFELANAARRVIEGALGVVAGEHVMLLVDRARLQLGQTLLDVALSLGARATLMELEQLGPRPMRHVPSEVRSSMQQSQASVVLIGFEEGESAMRLELVTLVRQIGLRHAHMVGVTRRSMLAGFSVDPSRILDTTRNVRTRLRPDSRLHLRSAAGSDLEVRLDPTCRWMEHVGIIRPGRWENLPSGELVTCPADVRGVLVADASIGGHFGAQAGVLTRTPVKVEIEGGVCRAVHCDDRALKREVERTLASEFNANRVGAVTLGTNIGMSEPLGELLCDQNLPGLHIGFGATFAEQTGAKWNATVQLSMTSANGDVDLDGVPLLRRGRYLIF